MPVGFELRYALRRLRRAPTFSAIVIATLAMGIGASSAVFSIVNGVLLRPLGYSEPGQLVILNHYYPSLPLTASVSAIGFQHYRDNIRSFSGVAAQTGGAYNLTGAGEPERVRGSRVSAQFFSVLGIAPARGRTFRPDEEGPGHRLVVLSDGFWRRRFEAKPDIVDSDISLNGENWTVIGVMPPGFEDPSNQQVEMWTPLAIAPEVYVPGNFTNEFLSVTARLKPGVTLEAADIEMRAYAELLKKDYPNSLPPSWTLTTRSMMEVRTGGIRTPLLVLLGAVAFVLLIACANVANLLLARAAAREREIAVRTALGAARGDIVRQLLMECVVLSGAGGAIGLFLAWAGVRALVAMNPGNVPRLSELGVDGTVALFTLGLSVVTGVAFGLVPAIRTSREDLQSSLKDGGRSGTADRGAHLLRRSLVVSEVALALTLLTGAGLLITSFSRLSQVDPGFDQQNLLTFNVALPQARYSNDTLRRAFFGEAIPKLAALPGVESASATSVLPFSNNWSTGSFNVEGYITPQGGNSPWGDIRIVTPGFIETLRVPVKSGRSFVASDVATSPLVAVVDEELVRRFFKPGEEAIGRHVWFGPATPDSSTRLFTIVGIVGHTKHEGLDASARVQLYLPVAQIPNVAGMSVAIRTTAAPLQATNAARGVIQAIDPQLPVSNVATMESLIESSLGQRRLSMFLLALFSGIALLLSSIGIYGVMSYAVAQRSRELGVRLALGASPQSLLGLVFRQGAVLTALGIVLGLGGAYGLTRLIGSQLFEVRATDPATFALVTAVLAAVAAVATLVPAWRATRIDPIVTLREE